MPSTSVGISPRRPVRSVFRISGRGLPARASTGPPRRYGAAGTLPAYASGPVPQPTRSTPALASALVLPPGGDLLLNASRKCCSDQARLPRTGGLGAGGNRGAAGHRPEKSSGGEVSGGLEKKVLAMIFMVPSLRTGPALRPRCSSMAGTPWVLEPGKGTGHSRRSLARLRDGASVEKSSMRRGCWAVRRCPRCSSFPRGTDWAVARQTAYQELRPALREAGHQPESARRHPCQALADAMTLREKLARSRAKRFVLTWAWHPKALPTAVPAAPRAWPRPRLGMEIVIARPEGTTISIRRTAR